MQFVLKSPTEQTLRKGVVIKMRSIDERNIDSHVLQQAMAKLHTFSLEDLRKCNMAAAQVYEWVSISLSITNFILFDLLQRKRTRSDSVLSADVKSPYTHRKKQKTK